MERLERMILLQAPLEGQAGIWWFNSGEKHPVAGCSGSPGLVCGGNVSYESMWRQNTHELVQSGTASMKTKVGPFPTALPSNVVWNGYGCPT